MSSISSVTSGAEHGALVTRPLPRGPLSIVCGNAFSGQTNSKPESRTSGNFLLRQLFRTVTGWDRITQAPGPIIFLSDKKPSLGFRVRAPPCLHRLLTSSHPSLSLPLITLKCITPRRPSSSSVPLTLASPTHATCAAFTQLTPPLTPCRSQGGSPARGKAPRRLASGCHRKKHVLLLSSHLLCTLGSFDALDTSIVSGITFNSLAVLLLIPASDLIDHYRRLVHTTASRCAAGP